MFSGVYDRSGSNRRLVVLLSNLANTTQRIDLPNVIGGFRALNPNGGPNRQDDFDVAAGEHRELTFTLGQRNGRLRWVLNSNNPVFTDNDRNGIGIPEPTSAALLGIGALGLLARRRRQTA